MEIRNLKYHRNEICGEPFFSAIVVDPAEDAKGEFLITWRTKNNDEQNEEMDLTSVRAIQLDHPEECWRGDRLGKLVQEKLRFINSFYPEQQKLEISHNH